MGKKVSLCNQSMRSRDGCAESVLDFISITPDITDGTYVLNIASGRQVFRTIIVKKGGAE